jgi:hypothetical protein
MNAQSLHKLAKLNLTLEKNGFCEESDKVSSVIIKLAANWQSPWVDLPMLERKWPYNLVDKDFEDADEQRQKFPRYDEKEDIEPADVDDVEILSLEAHLHPNESNAKGGIKFIWPDFASSLMQGTDWGKSLEEHDKNNASGMRYKNLVPTFY